MTEPNSRETRYEERRRLILDAARERADAKGWAAVTTRHLAATIGYTQPVLYGHFPEGKTAIMMAVALDGFVDLTRRCEIASEGKAGSAAIESVARAYLDFSREHPAVYEAMFQLDIEATFASDTTPPDIRSGFTVLSSVIDDDGDGTDTELFWGALHGISLLERAGRMRPEHREARIAALGVRFAGKGQH